MRPGGICGALWGDDHFARPHRRILKRAGEQRKGEAKHAQVAPFACRHEVTAPHLDSLMRPGGGTMGLHPSALATSPSGRYVVGGGDELRGHQL